MEVNIISFALEFSYLSFTNTYPHKFDINVLKLAVRLQMSIASKNRDYSHFFCFFSPASKLFSIRIIFGIWYLLTIFWWSFWRIFLKKSFRLCLTNFLTNLFDKFFDGLKIFFRIRKLLLQHYFFSGCYKLALRDIELSLTSGYPEDKAFKLEERKGE